MLHLAARFNLAIVLGSQFPDIDLHLILDLVSSKNPFTLSA